MSVMLAESLSDRPVTGDKQSSATKSASKSMTSSPTSAFSSHSSATWQQMAADVSQQAGARQFRETLISSVRI
jgi:hypothetical protein